MSADDRLRGLLNEFGAPDEPTADQRDGARRDLYKKMRAADGTQKVRRPLRSIGWAAGTVAAVVIAAVVILPSSAPSVDANLANIARAARTVTAADLPDGSYVYVHIESRTLNVAELKSGGTLRYVLPASTDLWARPTSEVEVTTAGQPEFSEDADRAIYESEGLAKADNVGVPVETPLQNIDNRAPIAGLSTDRDKLRTQIHAQLSADPSWTADDEPRVFHHVAQLLAPRFNAPPDLRAALLEILGELDVTTTVTADGGVVVELGYSDVIGLSIGELEFDREGFLRVERDTLNQASAASGLEPGLISEIRYSRPTVVSDARILP